MDRTPWGWRRGGPDKHYGLDYLMATRRENCGLPAMHEMNCRRVAWEGVRRRVRSNCEHQPKREETRKLVDIGATVQRKAKNHLPSGRAGGTWFGMIATPGKARTCFEPPVVAAEVKEASHNVLTAEWGMTSSVNRRTASAKAN